MQPFPRNPNTSKCTHLSLIPNRLAEIFGAELVELNRYFYGSFNYGEII